MVSKNNHKHCKDAFSLMNKCNEINWYYNLSSYDCLQGVPTTCWQMLNTNLPATHSIFITNWWCVFSLSIFYICVHEEECLWHVSHMCAYRMRATQCHCACLHSRNSLPGKSMHDIGLQRTASHQPKTSFHPLSFRAQTPEHVNTHKNTLINTLNVYRRHNHPHERDPTQLKMCKCFICVCVRDINRCVCALACMYACLYDCLFV